MVTRSNHRATAILLFAQVVILAVGWKTGLACAVFWAAAAAPGMF